VVFLAAGAGWWFGAGPGALRALPELTNRSVAEAQTALSQLDLNVTMTNEYSPEVPQGQIIRTEPAAGSLVFSGAALKLVVSLGPELKVAPKLTGLNVAEATVEITKAGFTFGGAEAWFNALEPGKVFDFTGIDGQKLPVGSAINLKVSLGPIPSVSGVSQEVATGLLTAVGLSVDKVTMQYSDTVPNGQVISLVPASEPLGENGKVELIVSRGSDLVVMPKVVGETIAAASSALKALGLVVVVDTDKLSSQWGIAKVKAASVKAGNKLRRGDRVTIVSR
jgi:serine/threonine-protein kinase